MPTAFLADDEPIMRSALRERLHAFWPDLEIVAEAEDGSSALRQIEVHRPDLAFLDIRMPGMTGLQVARSITTDAIVVFVTAYDVHALEAFDANAVDYVLKPLDDARFARLVGKLKTTVAQRGPRSVAGLLEAVRRLQHESGSAAERPATTEWLQVSMGTTIRMVHVNDVMFFASDTKYTRVVSADCDGLIRLSLKELLAQIDPRGFQQTHRSTVVNRRFIRSVHRTDDVMELELKDHPERIKVSLANHHLFRSM